MKSRKTKLFHIAGILVLVALFTLAEWHIALKTEVKNDSYSEPVNSNISQSISEYDGADEYYGYETVNMAKDDIHRGNLILVNSENAYQFEENNDLASVESYKNDTYKVKNKSVMLNKDVIAAFNAMMTEFNRVESSNAVNIVSGYRTKDQQQSVLNNKIASTGEAAALTWAARPGFSEHHSGLAFDLGLYFNNKKSSSFSGTGVYAWVHENCEKYGFVVRYPQSKTAITKISYEPWHLRYVGIPHASAMKENDLCFEEYVDFIRDYPFDGEHFTVSADGKSYEIYFAGEMTVPVPKDGNYEISGNNVDGFIVTVEKE
jgi:D-alanyl-D-alanine carboxypeptidase